jgi:Domain of unknown function (DUF5680)
MAEMIDQLNDFIVRAKAATYIGGGREGTSCRSGSHDLEYNEGAFHYLDSYFGGSDFIGEEVVYHERKPVWAMNYYGRILVPESITAEETGAILKRSLPKLYQQKRFLGGFECTDGKDAYFDTNEGKIESFTGQEWIERDGVCVYVLVYHGGLIK